MTDAAEFVAVCSSREQAHLACLRAYDHAKVLLETGQMARVACGPTTEPVSVKLRHFFHGPILNQISEQATVAGQRYAPEAWKELFRKRFVGKGGYRWKVMQLPGWHKPAPVRLRMSTEELGNRAYAAFCDEVIAAAADELGVDFTFTNEEQGLLRHKPKAKDGNNEHEHED